MGQARAPAAAAFALTNEELVAAEAIVKEVHNLADALHKLEYLTRLPHLIAEEESKLLAVQGTLQDVEEQVRLKWAKLAEIERMYAERERSMSQTEDHIRSLQTMAAQEEARLEDIRRLRESVKEELRQDLAP